MEWPLQDAKNQCSMFQGLGGPAVSRPVTWRSDVSRRHQWRLGGFAQATGWLRS